MSESLNFPNNNTQYSLVPELGDLVTFVSSVLKSTTGRIVYRDGELIRIRPSNSSSTAVDFPLDPTTGLFLDSLGVTEVLIHRKRKDPHFSKQISVVPGEILEFFTSDGKPARESGIVFEVIANEQYDAIKLEDGTVLDFAFLGPQPPVSVLRPRAPPESAVPPENESESVPETEAAPENFPDIDLALLPAALVEEIPSEERTYSDSVQREDMFVSLLIEETPKKQKDPRVMQYLYRLTDVLLALKNSVIVRDATGTVIPEQIRTYTADTLDEVVARQPTGAPISAIMPVAAVKKVIYGNVDEKESLIDTEFRPDVESLIHTQNAATQFLNGSYTGNEFIAYMNDVLTTLEAYTPAKAGDAVILVDQDVLRSQMPDVGVEGIPSVPKYNKKEKQFPPLTPEYIGAIQDRTVRLLSATRITNTKTRTTYTVAPADTGETVGHMILSPGVASFRSPIRSSVLLWDIQASQHSRNQMSTFYKTFLAHMDKQKPLGAKMTVAKELKNRLPPVVSFIQSESVNIMDGLGLRTLELTPAILEAFAGVSEKAQAAWLRAYNKLAAAAGVAAVSARMPTVAAVIAESSPLIAPAVMDAPQLAGQTRIFKAKETFLGGYDLAVANEFLQVGNTTFGPLWYAVAGNLDPELVTAAEILYTSESGRMVRNDQVARNRSAEFTASPDINPCEHVNEYEKIRGIRNDEARMVLFERFLKKFQAGQDGNYILCGACGKDLVCKHEVLLLNEYLNPGRGASLHKALLLEYAGPVFEGAYICKTCGQKIMDIEYDTHMEFDDEGRPLIGRSVLTDDAEEEDFALTIRAEADAEIPFRGSDRTLYFNQRKLFELCGMALGLETYTKTVAAAKLYLEKYVKTEVAYVDLQRKLAAARKPVGYEFKTYFGNQIVGTIGALAVLELQTTTINIPIAAAGCVLSRDGFPLDGLVPESAGVGALHYVACALSQIKSDDAPWNTVSWSPESNMEKRIKEAERTILNILNTLLAVPLSATQPRPLIEGITEPYRAALEAAKERKMALTSGTTMTALASSADKLPPSFRPLPRIVADSALEEEPIGNVKRFEANVASRNFKAVGPTVQRRMRQLNQNIVGHFYSEAGTTGVINPNTACSESVCCFKRLEAVANEGLGVASLPLAMATQEEIRVVVKAATTLWNSDPTHSSNGSHIYVPWSAPIYTSILPEADSSIYYKLFLKTCFTGRTFGMPHELGQDYICRNCGFAYPEELIYLTAADIGATDGKKRTAAIEEMEKRRTAVSLEALKAVKIDEQTFKQLEGEIRRRKTVPTIVLEQPVEFMNRLKMLGTTLGFLLPDASADWASLLGAMDEIHKQGLVEVRRLGKLADFSRRFDERLKQLRTVLIDTSTERKEKVVLTALDALVNITQNVAGGLNIRNLQSVFIVGGMQIAREYYVEKPTNMKVWFPTINMNHKLLLQDIWKSMSETSRMTINELDEFDDDIDTKDLIRKVLERFTGWFSGWLQIWRNEFRPDIGFTAAEFTRVLQWSAISGIISLATYDGPLYADGKSLDSQKMASSFICDWVVRALIEAGDNTKRYQLTTEQIKERVNARIEKEKQMFITKLDKKEPELRKLELMKKKLKIGDWSVGTTKKLFSYDPEMFEFERSQRAEMGVPDFSDNVLGQQEEAETAAEAAGFFQFGIEEVGMGEGVLHRAAQDEDDAEATEGAGRIHISC